MSGATAAKPRPELVDRIGELARETGSAPEELEAAAQAWAEHERRKAAQVQGALDEPAAGAPTYDAQEGTSVTQFVNVAVAEKVAALRRARTFEERAARADVPGAIDVLRRMGRGKPPVPGDELDAPADEGEIIRTG